MSADGSPCAASRTSRRTRRPRGTPRLKPRDVDVLFALAKMRLLKTSAISDLFFSAKGTAQKRLRKLFDAGLVRAVVTDLASENRYALTALGHALVVEAMGDEAVPALLPVPRVDGRRLTHLDLLNGLRIVLARAAPSEGLTLERFQPEWELRAEDPHAAIVPDAIFTITDGRRAVTLALEVDVGTEPPHVVLRKLDRYASARIQRRPVFGVQNLVPLIFVPSPRRARSIARAVRRDHPEIAIAVARLVLGGRTTDTGFAKAHEVPLEGDLDERVFGRGLLDAIQVGGRAVSRSSAQSGIGRTGDVRDRADESGRELRATASRSRSARA